MLAHRNNGHDPMLCMHTEVLHRDTEVGIDTLVHGHRHKNVHLEVEVDAINSICVCFCV